MEIPHILLVMMHRVTRLIRSVYRRHVAVVRTVFLLAIVFLFAFGVSGGSRNLLSIDAGRGVGLHA